MNTVTSFACCNTKSSGVDRCVFDNAACKHRQLPRPDGNHPDLARLQQISESSATAAASAVSAHPRRRRLRRSFSSLALVSGEQRSTRDRLRRRQASPSPALVLASSVASTSSYFRAASPRFGMLDGHSNGARRLRAERREQHPVRDAVIRLGIVRRHRALIRPEQRDLATSRRSPPAGRAGRSAQFAPPDKRHRSAVLSPVLEGLREQILQLGDGRVNQFHFNYDGSACRRATRIGPFSSTTNPPLFGRARRKSCMPTFKRLQAEARRRRR